MIQKLTAVAIAESSQVAGGCLPHPPAEEVRQSVYDTFVQNPEALRRPLGEHVAHLGMGCSSRGVPIDVLTLLFAGEPCKTFDIMIADAFHRFNGVSSEELATGLNLFETTLDKIREVFDLSFSTHRASATFDSEDFKDFVETLRVPLLREHHSEMIQCIPENKRHLPEALQYPLHEVAMTCYLGKKDGTTLKLGPSRELLYDKIAQLYAPSMEFAYAVDALPLALRDPRPVVHYVPTDVGAVGGGRILLSDDGDKLTSKLNQINESSFEYYKTLGASAATLLGMDHLALPEPGEPFKRQRAKVARLIREAIIEPLRMTH